MKQNRIVGIVGPKGAGKTRLAAQMFGREDRALVYQIVRTNPEYDVYATHTSAPEGADIITACRVLHKEDKFRIVYKVPDREILPRGKELVYTSAVQLVEECYLEGNMTLYLDEAHELCSQWVIDWRLRKVFRLARNQELNIVWIAHGMEVHREIRRNTDELYLFYIWEPGDLDKIAERCGDEAAERVSHLRRLTVKNGVVIPPEYFVWKAHE